MKHVATWKRCRDLGGLTEQGREVATCAHDLGAMRATCAGCTRDVRVTSLLCAQQRPLHGHCARSVRATWVVGCVHCAPNPVLTQCTVCSHCLDNCSWTLFIGIYQKKKKEYKNFKIFLVGDLIYKIFILHLLRCVNSVSGLYLHPFEIRHYCCMFLIA